MSKLLEFTEEDLRDLNLPRVILDTGQDQGDTVITLNSGKVVKKKTRQIIMLLIGLRPHLHFKIPLTPEHFDYNYTGSVSRGYKFKVWTKYYKELLEVTDIDHHILYGMYAEAVNYLSNLIVRYLGPYQQSMSILSLSRIQCDKNIKAIVDKPLDEDLGTDYVEEEINRRTKEIIKLISTDGSINNNVLLPFMWAGALKKNQIPQQMIAYGARSDIDDKMMKHVVKSSAISGIKDVTEYAIEGLSVKKSEHYKKSVIRDSQYSARGTRLNCAILPGRYMGDCGSKLLLPYTIPDLDTADNYVDKICFCNGEKIYITEEILPKLVGEKIELISPMGCKYTDGICERCAGRATRRPWAFMPNVHLGIYSATKVGEAVSQMVLSAKHLIKTKSIVYGLPEKAKSWFVKNGTMIMVNPSRCDDMKTWQIIIPQKFLGHITNYGSDIKFEENFNDVHYIKIRIGDEVVRVDLTNDRVSPYFSIRFRNYIRSKRNEIIITEQEEYIIPMDKFNIRWPIMKFDIINDDMVSYTKACDTFIKSKISSYTSATSALHDFASVIYSKSSINIFYLEVLLRTMMRKHGDIPGLPICDDFDNVRFDGICRNIATHTLSQKLSYERIGMSPKSDGLLAQPEVSLTNRLPGLFDVLLFGNV